MRFVYNTVFILTGTLLLTCNTGTQHTIQEIKNLEYQRTVNREYFIRWLNDNNAEVRAGAVKSLGRIQDTSTISWVANRLSDPEEAVRAEAAFAMGQFFSTIAENPLRDAIRLEESARVRSMLLEALGKCGTEKSFSIIRDYLNKTDSELQQEATIACGLMAYRGFPAYDLMSSLNQILKSSESPEISWRAAYAFYRIGSASAFKSLIDLLTHPDPITRYYTLKTQSIIVDYIKKEASARYQSNLLISEIKRMIQSEKYTDFLETLLEDSTWYVRLEALQIIGSIKPTNLLPAIQKRIEDENPHIRTLALKTIAISETRESRRIIDDFLAISQDWRDCGEVLLGLSESRPQQAISYIQNKLASVSWPENYYFIQTLGNIKTKSSNQLLLKLADTGNIAQMSLALEILSRRSGILTSEMMLQKLEIRDPAITTIMADRLAQLKDTMAVSALIETYRYFQAPMDLEPMMAILVALDSIYHPSSIPFLKQISDTTKYLPLSRIARQSLQRITGHRLSRTDSAERSLARTDFPGIPAEAEIRVILKTTRGNFELELFPNKAPVTVANFLDLV
ncbi:MAG: hypothetical protein EH225_10540, partial [Calditrichaeota bacterium]